MKKHITAFYLETLLLVTVFIAIILVLTNIFSAARVQTTQARHLTQAVVLAESAAEAVAASDSFETLNDLVAEMGVVEQVGDDLVIHQDPYLLQITWEPDGDLVNSRITVIWNNNEIYVLETAVYTGGVK